MTPARFPMPTTGRHPRRNTAILTVALAAIIGALMIPRHHARETLGYVDAEDLTVQTLDDIMWAAIEGIPDPAIAPEDFTPCANDPSGGHGYSMNTHTTYSTGDSPQQVAAAADKLVDYLRHNGYSGVTRDPDFTVHGHKGVITVTMRFDAAQHVLSFSAATGCDVQP